MKRIISVILALLLTISLCACGNSSGSSKIEMPDLDVSSKKDSKNDSKKDNKKDDEESSGEAEEPSPEPASTPTPIPCKHMWVDASFFAPKTCSVCGETEGNVIPNYFDENGIPVSDFDGTGFILPYIIYYKYDKTNFATVETDASVLSYGERSVGNGMKEVFLTFNADLMYTYDKATHIGRSNLNFEVYFFDLYTGTRIPVPNTNGDASVGMTTTLSQDGKNIDVTVQHSISWSRDGNWIYDENGDGTKTTQVTSDYVFTIPEDYDGLVICPAFQTVVHESSIETDNPSVIPDVLSLKSVNQFEGTNFYRLIPNS